MPYMVDISVPVRISGNMISDREPVREYGRVEFRHRSRADRGIILHRWVRNRVIVRVDRRRTVREIAPISRRQTVRQTIREILLRLSVRTDRLTVRRLGVVRRLGAVWKLVESQKSGNVRRVRNARRIVEM